MKLTPSFCVAVYSAKQCSLFCSQKVPIIDGSLSSDHGAVPSVAQIKFMQSHLFDEINGKIKHVVVVVPDSWLSITEHQVNHLIPPKLGPLVALTYAAEQAFAAPENLCFNYRQKVLQGQQTQLTVFTCTSELVDLLCLPFKQRNMKCLLLSHQQWLEAQRGKKSWRWFTQQSLEAYQPEKEKRRESRRLVACLISISLLINLLAYLCIDCWNRQSRDVLLERQQIMARQAGWSLSHSSPSFADEVLALTQALPMSVRMVSFAGDKTTAIMVLTLPKKEVSSLFEAWREKRPRWQWELKKLASDKSFNGGQEEVVDVAISIAKI